MSIKRTPTSISGLRAQREQKAADKKKVVDLEATNAELVEQITDLHLAIVELYEGAASAGGAKNG